MKAVTAWWIWIKTQIPISRKAARIAKRQHELDEKMAQLTQRVERIVDERDRTRREFGR
jgi:hypothetical protein